MKNFTVKAATAVIETEIQLDNAIRSIKGDILRNMVGMVEGYNVTEKNVERYLSDLKAAKIANGTSERTAAADGSQRKPILLFITGNTIVERSEAEQKVSEFMANSLSMQALSKQVKDWVKEAEEAKATVNNINNDDANNDTQDDAAETEEVVINLPEIESEPMPTTDTTTEIAISNDLKIKKTDNLSAYLKGAIDTGWTFEQIREELDKLEAELMSKAA